jgi:hypothetical protein
MLSPGELLIIAGYYFDQVALEDKLLLQSDLSNDTLATFVWPHYGCKVNVTLVSFLL